MKTQPKETNGIIHKDFTLEIHATDEQKGEFEGVASVMGVKDQGNDIIEPGAFTKTLRERPVVPVLWQHKSTEVIGSGKMSEQGDKILIKGTLDMEDPVAVNAYRKIKKGLISGLSIGFQTIKRTWEETAEEFIRHITELKLWEVSIVTFPMLPEAQITAVKQDSSLAPEPGGTPAEPPKPAAQADTKSTEPEVLHSLLKSIIASVKEN